MNKPNPYTVRAYSSLTGQLEAQRTTGSKRRAERMAKQLCNQHGLAFIVNGKTTMLARAKGRKSSK